MKYYEITLAEADSIGYQQINAHMAINAKAAQLKNGNYIVREEIVDYIKKEKEGDKLKGIFKSKPKKNIAKKDINAIDVGG